MQIVNTGATQNGITVLDNDYASLPKRTMRYGDVLSTSDFDEKVGILDSQWCSPADPALLQDLANAAPPAQVKMATLAKTVDRAVTWDSSVADRWMELCVLPNYKNVDGDIQVMLLPELFALCGGMTSPEEARDLSLGHLNHWTNWNKLRVSLQPLYACRQTL